MSRRRKTSVSTLHIVLGVIMLFGALIVLGWMLAPSKPAAPPVSRMTWEKPPEKMAPNREAEPRNEAVWPRKKTAGPPPHSNPVLEEKPYLIRVTVKNARDGSPLPGATVMAHRIWTAAEETEWKRRALALPENSSGAEHAALLEEKDLLQASTRLRTGRNGRAETAVAMAGEYTLSAHKPGYLPKNAENAILEAETPVHDVVVALSSGATLAGRVSEEGAGRPAAGIPVIITPVSPGDERSGRIRTLPVKTDEEGRYLSAGLIPGEYEVRLDLSNTPWKTGPEIPYRKIMVHRPDQNITGVNFKVDPAGIVWGRVTTPDNEAVAGANVLLCSSESLFSQALSSAMAQTPPLHGISDETGYYELIGVPLNSEWRVYATAESHSPQLADPFLLTRQNREARIDIFLFSGSDVTGFVIDPAGAPIAGADVLCIPAFSKLLSPMDTPQAFRSTVSGGDNGAFELADLPAGNYQIYGRKEGYKLAAMGTPVYPDGFSPIRNVAVTLYPADEGAHAVYGVVTDTADRPVSGASVALEGLGSGSFSSISRNAATDNQGRFHFAGVETGMYSLTAAAKGFTTKTAGRVLLDKENRIVLSASALVRGKVAVRETGQAPEDGFTISARPDPGVSGARLSMDTLAGPAASNAFTSADGAFEIETTPGDILLEAKAAGFTPARTSLTLEAGETVTGVKLYLTRDGGKIAGRVTTESGESPQGAVVMLIEAGSENQALLMLAGPELSGEKTVTAGADGRFVFDMLPPGAYVLVARHPAWAPAKSGVIHLDTGGREDGVVLRLAGGGAIEGYVYQNNQPVSGAMILLTGETASENVTTDENGYYIAEGLSAGEWQLMVTSLSSGDITDVYGMRSGRVEIENGRTSRYDFGAGGGVRIEGQCMPGPPSILGGRAVLRYPGPPAVPLGETADLSQLQGQSTGIDPSGAFAIDDVPPGSWQLDIFYMEFGGPAAVGVRYVHTELIEVSGETDLIPLEIRPAY
jgi:protocatechuate 3,4-dioxygenase beta subunit